MRNRKPRLIVKGMDIAKPLPIGILDKEGEVAGVCVSVVFHDTAWNSPNLLFVPDFTSLG